MGRKTTVWIFQAVTKRNLSREDLDMPRNEKPLEKNGSLLIASGWGCRILWLHLPNECPAYSTKQSDGEVENDDVCFIIDIGGLLQETIAVPVLPLNDAHIILDWILSVLFKAHERRSIPPPTPLCRHL